jgi:hypothetical protein
MGPPATPLLRPVEHARGALRRASLAGLRAALHMSCASQQIGAPPLSGDSRSTFGTGAERFTHAAQCFRDTCASVSRSSRSTFVVLAQRFTHLVQGFREVVQRFTRGRAALHIGRAVVQIARADDQIGRNPVEIGELLRQVDCAQVPILGARSEIGRPAVARRRLTCSTSRSMDSTGTQARVETARNDRAGWILRVWKQ